MNKIDYEKILDEISEILGPSGPLSKVLDNYEFRQCQEDMAFGVFKSFFTSRHALIESGTGTGKSIAYLIPAILWAFYTHEKIVISTNTINLQEQLIYKDLPSIQNCFNHTFKDRLVKGRQNYICLRKLAVFSDEMENETDFKQQQAFTELFNELSVNRTGSRSDFSINIPTEIWNRLESDSLSCLKTRCPWFKQCYFIKARSEMKDAGIIITNHHLLFSDLVLRTIMPNNPGSWVLPEYEYLILDEAHNIPDIAEEHLTYNTNLLNIDRLHNELISIGKTRKRGSNLLNNLRIQVPSLFSDIDREDVHKIISHIDTSIESTRRSYETSTSFFHSVDNLLKNEAEKYKHDNNAIRLDKYIMETEDWKNLILPQGENAIIRCQELENHLIRILKFLDIVKDDIGNSLASMYADIQGITSMLASEISTLNFIMAMEDSNFVYWGARSSSNVHLNATPLNVSDYLQESLFDKIESVVLTSATIAVEGRFQFFKNLIGLEGRSDPPLEFIFNSPFDFQKQALLLIPKDLPDPRDPMFIRKASELITNVIQISKGRAFVLFTAHTMLKKMEEIIRPDLERSGIRIFKQGTTSRHHILECFRETPGVLFGADSFWQGVDVPGDALSCVVLVRLPFQVPTGPVYKAKMEFFESQGINGFMSYAVPSAIIRFRQGFGRLIRNSKDRGVIVVLDNRLIRKRYGRAFISSLPDIDISVEDCNEIVKSVGSWLGGI